MEYWNLLNTLQVSIHVTVIVSPDSLGGNNIGDAGIEAFSKVVHHMPNLQYLE